MKNIILLFAYISVLVIAVLSAGSCATTNAISQKSGVELWSENCNRCHNIPSPINFKDAQWEKIGMHMKVRANLTEEETKKIIEFMQSAN